MWLWYVQSSQQPAVSVEFIEEAHLASYYYNNKHCHIWTSGLTYPIIIIIIIIKSSVDRDNNYCHYVILRIRRLRNYATLSSGWTGGYLWY
jgi:hypothetical protein